LLIVVAPLGLGVGLKAPTTLAGAQGLVVRVAPSAGATRGFVLLASGAAGADAAALASQRPGARPNSEPSIMTLRIGVARSSGYIVRTIPLEEYVAGVLAGEAARNSSPSALEALAITVRTFALANLSRHRADGFDLCDLTHCQVLRKATLATESAATGTAGRVLLYRGALASVFYTASCGGRTEQPSHVWPGASDPEYLPSRNDDACDGMPVWTAELSAADLMRSLEAAGFKGDAIRDLRVLSRNESGRVARLRLDGLSPGQISGQDLRVVVGRTLGWQHIQSTTFDVQRTAAGYRFSGHGSGHGVGLCVIGSARLGARGQSASEILARYFPGATISPLPSSIVAALEPKVPAMPRGTSEEPRIGAAPPREPIVPTPRRASASAPAVAEVLLSLPSGDEGERDVLHDLALHARDELAKDLGVASPPRVILRLHPTIESYQRATGQPWYTAGATVDTDIHLVPLTVLRERGLVERTIRHELVHVLTRTALSNRPLWVREGTATYFAGAGPVPGESARRAVDPGVKISCPDDRELLRPASPGALSNAYARAAACVGRQIAAGKKWSEIR
jgi:SpoIID/LytB domain protein